MQRNALVPAAVLTALAGLAAPARAQCPPSNPTGLSASDGTYCGSVFLNWNDVTGANTYNIYRNTVNNYSTSGLAGVSVTSQFTDLTASVGQIYYYWVTATHTLCLPGSGTSGPSAVNAGYRGQDPLAPVSVFASDDDFCNAVRVQWTIPTPPLGGASSGGFTIYRNTINLYLTSSSVGHVGAGQTLFDDYTAEPDTQYYYWVRAENDCGTAASEHAVGSRLQTDYPGNDSCTSAYSLSNGSTYFGNTLCASNDGDSNCQNSDESHDLWYRYQAQSTGTFAVSTCDSATSLYTVMSVHSGCPGTIQNQIACSSTTCSPGTTLSFPVVAGSLYLIRVSSWNGYWGEFWLRTQFTPSPTCYANCDGSSIAPVLNVLDFNCFLNRFASGDAYANCDGSSIAPVLNVLDFNCFLNRFAAGCP